MRIHHMHCYQISYKISVRKLHSTVNSPSCSSSSVVLNFVKPVNRDTSQVTSKQKNAQITSVAGIPSPVGSNVSLCMLCMDISSKSISDQTLSNETSSQHQSEVPLVQSVIQWSIFFSWCNQRQINPLTVNVQQIAEFLFEKQRGLAPRILSSNSIYLTAFLKNVRQRQN